MYLKCLFLTSSRSLSWWFLFSKSKGPEKAGGDNKTVLRIMKLELIKQEASYLYKPGLGPEDKSNGHGWTVLSQGLCGEGKISYESIKLAKDYVCMWATFCCHILSCLCKKLCQRVPWLHHLSSRHMSIAHRGSVLCTDTVNMHLEPPCKSAVYT